MNKKEMLIRLKERTNLSWKAFAEYFSVPYRTMQDWQLGNREMPGYLLRLMIYKIETDDQFCISKKQMKTFSAYSVMTGPYYNSILYIDSIRFKGKRKINWDEVEEFVKSYIGEYYENTDTKDMIHIGNDFPNEFTGSNDTARLRGTLAKAKANASQAIPQLLQMAKNARFTENFAVKHKVDAKYGWYRYTARFALPVCNEAGKWDRYNVFRIEMLIRHAQDGKKYLYDLVNIKKETSTPLEL